MSVNVEKIMQEIRNEIKEKGYSYDMLSFKDISVTSIPTNENVTIENAEKQLMYMDNISSVAAYRPLDGNKLFVIVKKIIRKLTKFYIEPIVASQNEFNKATVQSVSNLLNLEKAYGFNSNNDELSEKISTLELQIRTAYSEIKALNEKIDRLEAQNISLKNQKAE